jgi:pyruvate dehydrogenase E2 component (dihydrolipoamide acetyltransferase)
VAEQPAGPPSASHATPAVRRFARDLGVDLAKVGGTGRKGRIVREDVTRYVKSELTRTAPAAEGGGSAIPPIPTVDFGKFGPIETRPLSRIKRISGPHLQRAWLNLPHVTHHDEADITELEAFRQSLKDEAAKRGVRVTMLIFMMKALAACLREFPAFNASLGQDGQSVILKHYFHIGIAVDTPGGLVVPVVRDVDQKGVMELASELGEISLRAREGKLTPTEMQGGCMTISSLGGIGGTGFTPIINAPEVAILGAARSRIKPVWNGQAFEPRLMQPLDVSYDHRVLDGAETARFTAALARSLGDLRRLLL